MEPKRCTDVKRILEKFTNEDILFYDNYTELYFKQKPYKVFMAEQEANKILDCEGILTAFEYAELLGIYIPDELADRFVNAGWDVQCMDEAWISGLEFSYDYVVGDNWWESYYVIRLNLYPCDAYPECRGGR